MSERCMALRDATPGIEVSMDTLSAGPAAMLATADRGGTPGQANVRQCLPESLHGDDGRST